LSWQSKLELKPKIIEAELARAMCNALYDIFSEHKKIFVKNRDFS
jgi:hypothetical protein